MWPFGVRKATAALVVAWLVLAVLPATTAIAGDESPGRGPAPSAPGGSGVADDAVPPRISRDAGANRYHTAALVSRGGFFAGAKTVYLATGQSSPDALAAGAVAGRNRSPILLTTQARLPDATAAELARLAPAEVVVLGGTAAVSTQVEAAAAAASGAPTRRIAGANRFETAAKLSAASFSPGVDVAYVATGVNFPDALAGGPLAAGSKGPVLLVAPSGVPPATAAELSRLAPRRIVVFGGRAAVSDAVVDALARYTAGGVTRLAGADRHATAIAIARAG